MPVMMHVRGLQCVKARDHENAKDHEDPVLSSPANAKRVVLRTMRLAQSSQKEEERREETQRDPSRVKQRNRGHQPRHRQQDLVDLPGRGQPGKVSPFDFSEPWIPVRLRLAHSRVIGMLAEAVKDSRLV